jgi:hypothetical protein
MQKTPTQIGSLVYEAAIHAPAQPRSGQTHVFIAVHEISSRGNIPAKGLVLPQVAIAAGT